MKKFVIYMIVAIISNIIIINRKIFKTYFEFIYEMNNLYTSIVKPLSVRAP